MTRSCRHRTEQEQALAATGAPPATWRDGRVVVEVANAGVDAIIEAAARHGLDSEAWTAEQLYPRVAEIVAVALRRSPNWWVGRAPEVS